MLQLVDYENRSFCNHVKEFVLGNLIVVTSLKGGVGKTMFSAGLSFEAARLGKRVLAVDMDLGTGGLDIAMGREDEVCATLLDLLSGTVSAEQALIPGDDGVYFLSSPVFFNEASLSSVTFEAFQSLLSYLKEQFDLVVFDMPAGGGAAFRFFDESELVDLTVLVTTPAPTAVRAAERCAMRLHSPEKLKLLINCFRLNHPDENSFHILEVIRRTSVPIIGVVPYDNLADRALSRGVPLTGVKKSVGGNAIANITRRIFEETVPLLSGVLPKRKRSKFY
jgi:septum site-determining protein MinD